MRKVFFQLPFFWGASRYIVTVKRRSHWYICIYCAFIYFFPVICLLSVSSMDFDAFAIDYYVELGASGSISAGKTTNWCPIGKAFASCLHAKRSVSVCVCVCVCVRGRERARGVRGGGGGWGVSVNSYCNCFSLYFPKHKSKALKVTENRKWKLIFGKTRLVVCVCVRECERVEWLFFCWYSRCCRRSPPSVACLCVYVFTECARVCVVLLTHFVTKCV